MTSSWNFVVAAGFSNRAVVEKSERIERREHRSFELIFAGCVPPKAYLSNNPNKAGTVPNAHSTAIDFE